METGNRLMVCCMTVLAIACVAAAAYLTAHGYAATVAAFTGVAIQAIAALTPSALRQAKAAGDNPPDVSAEQVDTLNVGTSPDDGKNAKAQGAS